MLQQHTPSIQPGYVLAYEALRQGIQKLQAARIESASLDARLLLQRVLSITHEEWVANPERMMDAQQAARYNEMITQRASRVPLTHLLGSREFWGLDFKVTPATLDPRPDSETLIDAVMQRITDRYAPLHILDMGTGTGCLILSLLHELLHATGVAIDKSQEALAVAAENAMQLGLDQRVQFAHTSWEAPLAGQYDLIISNPPYIPSGAISSLMAEVSCHEPKLALDGGADGLACYRMIFEQLPTLLKPGGMAAFELGAGQLPSLIALAGQHGFTMEAMRKDIQGIPRCIIVKHTHA